MPKYAVCYACEVSHYGTIEIEEPDDSAAIEVAVRNWVGLTAVTDFEPRWDLGNTSQRIVSIERVIDETARETIAEDIDLAILGAPIQVLCPNVRIRKAMLKIGVKTVGELIQCTSWKLLAVKGFGASSLREVEYRLANLRLRLTRNPPPIKETE